MTDAARIAEWIADDFYGRRLDFSKRPGSGRGWSELPEVNIVPTELDDPRRVRLFLTFMAAVDKMVDAAQLWSAGADCCGIIRASSIRPRLPPWMPEISPVFSGAVGS